MKLQNSHGARDLQAKNTHIEDMKCLITEATYVEVAGEDMSVRSPIILSAISPRSPKTMHSYIIKPTENESLPFCL